MKMTHMRVIRGFTNTGIHTLANSDGTISGRLSHIWRRHCTCCRIPLVYLDHKDRLQSSLKRYYNMQPSIFFVMIPIMTGTPQCNATMTAECRQCCKIVRGRIGGDLRTKRDCQKTAHRSDARHTRSTTEDAFAVTMF